MSDSHIPAEADALPRRSIDAAAYERRSREGPCFICEMLAGNLRVGVGGDGGMSGCRRSARPGLKVER